jgi:tetratricopeptide (TPR) repeat protein
VKPGSIKDQRDQQLLVLKVCLGEIERCRPFLIALLGDHYGWIPPADRMRDAAREAGHRGNVSGRSITALEIEFGIQDNHDQKKGTWFYFRNPLPYSSMDSHTAALYSDEYSQESSVAGSYQRMTELKERITREMPDRVRNYEAGWDTEKKEVTNLDEWGRQVIEDLWGDLEEETRGLAQAQPSTWQEQESRVIGQFIETHCRELFGRDEELGKLRGIALGDGPELGVCVLGPPGSGKTALMTALARSLRNDDVLLLTHFTGISSRSTQVDSLLERWTGELAVALGQTDPSPGIEGRQQRKKAFAELLSQAAVRRRVVCLVDALNQFDSTQAAQYLTWLPELWPLNARLLATTLPGTVIALAKRRSVETLDLLPLGAGSVTAIASSVSDRYHTHLPDEIVTALLSHQLPDGVLAAGNPLWLELALQELMLLDGDDFSRAEKSYDGEAQEKLDALRLDIAWQLPAEIESLYQAMFRRAEKVHDSKGTHWAHGLSALLAASRTGWRESDFEALLPELAGDGWTNLRFAALRRTFRAHLVQRGASAQWDFFHAQARATAERWALSDSEARKLLHLAIARHLESLPTDDPLRQTETMVHLIGAQDYLLAARYYSSDLDPGELAGATQALAWLCLRDPGAGLGWYRGMLNHPWLEDDPAFELSHRCIFQLHDSLEDDAQVEDRIALLEAGRQRLEGLRQRAPNCAWYARDLSVSYSRLADLYTSSGELTQALEHYRRSLAILEEWRQRDPDGAEFARGLSVDNLHLSDLYVSLGDPTRALEHCRRSVVLLEELRQKAPDNADCARDFSVCYTKLGDLFVRLGESTRALEHYRQSLTIFEDLRQKAPDNAEPARNLSVSHSKLGDLCVKLGESAQALEHYRQSLAILHELRQRAPDHVQYAHDHLILCIRLGDLYVKLADFPQALEHYRQSLTISEESRQRVPDNAENARALGADRQELK